MKKLMLSAIALLSTAGLGSALQAQDPGVPPPPPMQDPAMPTDAPPPPPPPRPVVTDSTPSGALTPPPADAMNKDYPVCSKTVQDNCRNRGGV